MPRWPLTDKTRNLFQQLARTIRVRLTRQAESTTRSPTRLWRRPHLGLRNVRYAWGWTRAWISQLRQDRRPRNLLRGSIIVVIVVAVMAAGVVISPPLERSLTDPERSIRIPFSPQALLGADGLVYVGSSAGQLLTLDPVYDTTQSHTVLTHPVDYLVAYGDHVFAAGHEEVSRLTPSLSDARTATVAPGLTLNGLSAGPQQGIWAIGEPGNSLVRLGRSRLTAQARIHLGSVPSALGVTRYGVWVTERDLAGVVFITHGHRGWTHFLVPLLCRPNAIATEQDHAFVLCDTANLAVELTDVHPRILRTYSVGAGGEWVNLDNGSLWVVSPADDHVGQYALASGRRIDDPIGIGSEPFGLAVDAHAIWIGELADDTLTRLDLTGLVQARRARRTEAGLLGLPQMSWFLAIGMLLGTGITALVLMRQANANRTYPRYFPAKRILTYLICEDLYESISSGKKIVEVDDHDRSAHLGAFQPSLPGMAIRRSKTTTWAEFPLDSHVRETISALLRTDLLFRGLGYVPGVRHRGLRLQPAATPTASDLLAQFDGLANEGTLCLIAGGRWKVTEEANRLKFELGQIFDRTAGHLRVLDRPAEAVLSFTVSKSHLRPVGAKRCVSQEWVTMDVLAQALPRQHAAEMPQLDVIVAWHRAPGAGEWSQGAKDYSRSLAGGPVAA